MLGSHDSFTYLKTGNILIDAASRFWRCQEKTIDEQYKCGVRVFDVRVIDSNEDGFVWWRVGHGLAKVKQRFINLENICLYFKQQYPEAIIRIILESGGNNESIVERFKNESETILNKYKEIIWEIVIKKPWIYIYQSGMFKSIDDVTCKLFNWNLSESIWDNLKHFEITSSSIKAWAKKHNPTKITKKMKEDKKTLYFMDYVGTYPKL